MHIRQVLDIMQSRIHGMESNFQKHQEEVHINATINGTAVDGASLEKAVEKSGVAVDAVTSLTINSGKVTQEDLAYLKSISRLETFEMNVGDNLQLIGMDGQPTTVLSKDTAVIEFAPKRAGSSRADMDNTHIGRYYRNLQWRIKSI